MKALDVVSSRKNTLDREATLGPGDNAVDSSIGADVSPLDLIYSSCFLVATGDDVGLLFGGFLVEERGEDCRVMNGGVAIFYDHPAIGAFKIGLSLKLAIAVKFWIMPDGFLLLLVFLVDGPGLVR